MADILINGKKIGQIHTKSYQNLIKNICVATDLAPNDFYLQQNGRNLSSSDFQFDANKNVHCILRCFGGKGGFGSMLRAIGAQIEKTTNREACRDLSGRRLRDINEEKRLKAWMEKESDRQREAEERKKRKIEKLLTVPKHEFKDDEYEAARSKLTEKVSDAVEEGIKKALDSKNMDGPSCSTGIKRKGDGSVSTAAKKKPALWIDDDLSGSDESDTDSEPASDIERKAIEA